MSKSRIFLALMLCFVGGVALRSFVVVGEIYSLISIGVLVLVMLAFSRDTKVVLYSALAGISFFGMLWFSSFEPRQLVLEKQVGTKIDIEGTVVRDPEFRANTQRLVVAPHDTPKENILVVAPRYPEVVYGDTVLVTGTLKRPENFSGFDYAGYLAKDDIYFTMNYADVVVVREGSGIQRSLFAFKNRLKENIDLAMPSPHASFVNGILLGDTADMPKELTDAFVAAGVSHLTALSGYNITIIAIFVAFALSFFFTSSVAITALSIAGITLFVLMTGASPSVVRAAIMGVALLLARHFGRQSAPLMVIVFAAFTMIVFNPRVLLFDIGFQLSFLAVLGLAYVAPYLQKKMARVPEFLKWKESFATTMSAQVVVLPLLIYQFGQVSIVAPVVNVLVLPLMPFAMLFGFLTGVAGFITPFAATLFAYPLWLITAYQLHVIEYFASLPHSLISL
ncbi:MAG: ComEC family competence protein [Candidatus Azambacteria bacterium]|nr:ComEC family competence protein [Candidatus Azambacteria bacterium]